MIGFYSSGSTAAPLDAIFTNRNINRIRKRVSHPTDPSPEPSPPEASEPIAGKVSTIPPQPFHTSGVIPPLWETGVVRYEQQGNAERHPRQEVFISPIPGSDPVKFQP